MQRDYSPMRSPDSGGTIRGKFIRSSVSIVKFGAQGFTDPRTGVSAATSRCPEFGRALHEDTLGDRAHRAKCDVRRGEEQLRTRPVPIAEFTTNSYKY